jgi:ribosomal protein L23
MASSSVWRRVPAFLPNLTLKLVPLSEAQQAVYAKTGFVKELVFKTVPQATKGEIKNILEGVYGLEVEKVKTVNYLGKKKRGRDGFYRRADFKKAYVSLKGPEEGLAKDV